MSKIITNEQELNTSPEDLVTEHYALEVLGLKNSADFRKFSRSFMKLDKIIKEMENEKANKKHTHDDPEIISLDASKLKGTIDISRLPASALERCVVVADDTARFKLTKEQVQVGDSVKVTSPDNLMYIVVDDTKLNQEAGYIAYSAAVKWDTIKNKPELFPPASHTHTKNQVTDFAHTHDDRYYTEAEIDSKFKNLSMVAVPVGGVLAMWNNTNPAELYTGTTWELISSNKYIQSGSTALQTGGSNSVSIAKANLPNIKLKVDSFSVTTQAHTRYKWTFSIHERYRFIIRVLY